MLVVEAHALLEELHLLGVVLSAVLGRAQSGAFLVLFEGDLVLAGTYPLAEEHLAEVLHRRLVLRSKTEVKT